MTAAAWILSILLALTPAKPQPGHEETPEQYRARMGEIATVIADGVYGEHHGPLLAEGADATAARLIAVAYMESGFSHDADVGPCYRGRDGRGARCDAGRSVSLWQIQIGNARTPEGYVKADLWDRRKAERVAQRKIVASASCVRDFGPDAALNAYASGMCSRGHRESAARLALARKLLALHPRPVKP